MRVFLALAIVAAVLAGGAYAVVRSVQGPAAAGDHASTYRVQTTGSTSWPSSRIDWSDRINAGFDE